MVIPTSQIVPLCMKKIDLSEVLELSSGSTKTSVYVT